MKCIYGMCLLLIMMGCDERGNIGECHYDSIPGTATIVSIEPGQTGTHTCVNPVEVVFDFAPDDSTARERYLYPEWPDTSVFLVVGSGNHPPEEWVILQGITVGNQYPCNRKEDTGHSCPPVVFELLEIDFSNWSDYCY